MTICEDPFAVLGVQQDAPLDEVRRAYRRLAMHWHPDRNRSAAAASEFKRVHAAYELLLDPHRLAAWQRAQALGKASVAAGRAGDDLVQTLTLTLEEAAQGCRKEIALLQRVGCASCRGSGRVQHSHSVPCPRCSGCGRVAREGGRTSRCDGCAGRGYLHETTCTACAGSGWGQETRTLSVSVPAALVNGERLRLAGQAPLAPGDAIAGDLYLEIRLTVHPLFVLQGRDLHCQVPVSIFRQLCGGRVEVPTLRGTASVELPCCPQPLAEQRLPGLGFPGKGQGAGGDLVAHIETVYPHDMGGEDLALLERLEALLSAELDRRAPRLAGWARQMRARRNAG